MIRFDRLELRTTDVPGARAFYLDVLGADVLGADIVELPEQAAARGAVSHWLGHLGVDDVEATAQALVERGATRLGPTRTVGDEQVAIVRDGGGAIFALSTPRPDSPHLDVAWYLLNTADLGWATATYPELFGWELRETSVLGLFELQRFAWAAGQPSAGSMLSIADRPGVHPHWMFGFRVADLDAAIAAVSAGGGDIVSVVEPAEGERVVVCDDPQGAAFSLYWLGSRGVPLEPRRY